MNKMNFTRFTYFEEFVKNIVILTRNEIKSKAECICNEIDHQINIIYSKQKGAYWAVTDGDKVFIKLMQKLKAIINVYEDNNKLNDLIQLAKKQAEEKIKVVFLTQEPVVWPSFESVYHAMMQDNRYIVRLVYIPFTHINMSKSVDYFKVYKEEMGLPILRHSEYSISKDSPDIAIFIKPYDCIPMQYYIKDVNKVVRRCVYCPYGFRSAAGREYTKYAHSLPMQYYAWKIIADSPIHVEHAIKYGYRNGENMLLSGSPKLDAIRRPNNPSTIPDEWCKKINGRKVIMYNTHHSVLPNEGFGTFINYSVNLFNYFYNQDELVLLWRPHPLLENALVTSGLLTRKIVNEIFNFVDSCPNMILDKTQSYLTSFFASDALISDGTSFLKEYIFTEKPILYTRKHGTDCYVNDSKLLESYYIADTFDDIIRFCEMIKHAEDEKKELRLDKMRASFYGVDVSVADTIKNDFNDIIINEEKDRAGIFFNFYNKQLSDY